ncbi:MAG: complex I NDUFA9 subunit family protein [Ammonifex sp.]|jgi:NADH dehydrogenase|nr:MAG: complex I NDUFA9 subunit family protein [Ammonifex sp.]
MHTGTIEGKTKTILVTGGTGLVGRAVVDELLAAGSKVRCLVRNPGRAPAILAGEVEYVRGDVTDYESLRRAATGVSAVVHLVAVIREKPDQTFQQVNVEGTANTVRAAVGGGARRFIHVSAMGVKEGPAYRYAHSKWLGEEAVRQSGLDWTIIRPSLIYGPSFGFFDRMAQSIRTSPPPFVAYPASKARFQPIAVLDVARCVATALGDPRTIHQTYDIGGPEHFTYAEMLDVYLDVKRIRRIKLPLPVGFLRLVVPLMERIMRDPPVTSVELKQMEVNNTTELNAVYKHFGFRPQTLREGLRSGRAF